MRDSVRHFLSEFIGTFALTFVGSAPIMQATLSEGNVVAIALAPGLVLAVFVSAFMHVGAHFNPAVSVGLWAARRFPGKDLFPYVAAQVAGAVGVTGPNLRGSGVKFDVRKNEPYLGYEDIDFEVCIGKGEFGPIGSSYDRYMVRIWEVLQSCKIIRQVAAMMTPGDVQESIPKRVKPPAGEIYMRTETPKGELGYYIVSDGNVKPYRVKVKSPCFTAMSAFREISRGGMIADIIAILGSLDIVLARSTGTRGTVPWNPSGSCWPSSPGSGACPTRRNRHWRRRRAASSCSYSSR